MAELFVPLAVDYLDNPKILAVSESAELLYVRMLTVAKRLLTDGHIAVGHVRRYGVEDPDAVGQLVAEGLWRETDGGYEIVGWAERNKSADEVESSREYGRRGGLLSAHMRGAHDVSVEGCPKCETDPPDLPPSEPPSEGGSGGGLQGGGQPETETETETETEKKNTTSDADAPDPDEPEVSDAARELTRRFAKAVKANGHPLPSRNSKARNTWLRQMDLLLRKGPPGEGGHVPSVDEVAHVIDWATSDEFEAPNIQSVTKFRKRYSQLRMKAGIGRSAPDGVSEFDGPQDLTRKTA